MPASSGVRMRPNLGLQRSISARRLRIGGLTQMLPGKLVLSLAVLAMLTAATAVYWTGSIHNAETVAAIEAPATTGSVSKAN